MPPAAGAAPAGAAPGGAAAGAVAAGGAPAGGAAAAAAVVPVANNRNAMNQYLEDHLGVSHAPMRLNIQDSGFGTLTDLTRERPPFAKDVCNQVRKMTGGTAASKNIPMHVERGMRKLIIYARYCYLVQRDLTFRLA